MILWAQKNAPWIRGLTQNAQSEREARSEKRNYNHLSSVAPNEKNVKRKRVFYGRNFAKFLHEIFAKKNFSLFFRFFLAQTFRWCYNERDGRSD
jgi:hypothetical protein